MDSKKFRNGIHLQPLSADPSSPAEGDIFVSDGTSRGKGLWIYKDGAWTKAGGGSGGLDTFLAEDFQSTKASNFSSGNNASFLGGGTVAGTLADEEVNQIAGNRSIKFTLGAGSANDYIAAPAITLDDKQKGQDVGLTFYYTYDGADDDITVIVYDVTNASVISSSLDLIKNTSNPRRFSTSVFIPSTCNSIRYGFQVNSASGSEVFLFDDVELSTNPLVYKNLMDTQVIEHSAAGSTLLNRNLEVEFDTSNLTSSGSTILSIEDDSGNTRTKFVATRKCKVGYFYNAVLSGASTLVDIRKNGTRLSYGSQTPATSYYSFIGGEVELDVNDYITFGSDSTDVANTANLVFLYLSATAESEHVITPARSDINSVSGYNNASNSITGGTTDIVFTGSGTGWTGSSYTVQKSDSIINVTGTIAYTTNNRRTTSLYLNGTIYRYIGQDVGNASNSAIHSFAYQSKKGEFSEGDVLSIRTDVGGTLSNTDLHHVTITESGNATFLAAVPVQKVAYLKDVKASGTHGGTSTSDVIHQRDLNDLSGDTSFVSLASNQFTLQPGKYEIKASAPCYEGARHQIFLHDGTSYVLDGTSEVVTNGSGNQTRSFLEGNVEITTATTYQIKHWIQTGVTTTGLGFSASTGSNPQSTEVYTQVKITKLR